MKLPQAQYALGKLLLSDDLDVHDPTEGIRWMKAAAQNGNDYAAYALGKEYLSGKHVVKNLDSAKEYLQQAAENENPWAQYLLGKLYLTGEGAGADNNAAYAWFQAAAEHGHTYAQFFLNRMKQQGQHILPSLLLSATRLLHLHIHTINLGRKAGQPVRCPCPFHDFLVRCNSCNKAINSMIESIVFTLQDK